MRASKLAPPRASGELESQKISPAQARAKSHQTGLGMFDKLYQDAAHPLRMQKNDPRTNSARPRLGADKTRARRAQAFDLSCEIFDAQRDVMQTRPAFG